MARRTSVIVAITTTSSIYQKGTRRVRRLLRTGKFVSTTQHRFRTRQLKVVSFDPSRMRLKRGKVRKLGRVKQPHRRTLVSFLQYVTRRVTVPSSKRLTPFQFPRRMHVKANANGSPSLTVDRGTRTIPANIIPRQPRHVNERALFMRTFPNLVFSSNDTIGNSSVAARAIRTRYLNSEVSTF